jgi:hypothetical protein
MQLWILPAVVTCTFHKSFPLDKTVSADWYQWLTSGDLTGLESGFRYHLSEDEFQAPRATFAPDRLKPTRQPKARGAQGDRCKKSIFCFDGFKSDTSIRLYFSGALAALTARG